MSGASKQSLRPATSWELTPALRKARGSAPLPTAGMLRPLQPPPQGSVRLSVTPQLCSRWNQPHRVRVAKLPGSAPNAVTTTQCGVVCSWPPPAPSSGTRRPTVRSQSLATLQRIVCSYLLPGIRRLRSCLSLPRRSSGRMAVRHRPPWTHESRHAQPPRAPPVSCLMLPPPGANRTHRSGPCGYAVQALRASPPPPPHPPATPAAPPF